MSRTSARHGNNTVIATAPIAATTKLTRTGRLHIRRPRKTLRRPRALWVLGPVATAVPVTPVLMLAGADCTAALWFAALLWAIAASFVQALWQGLRQGDWSAFTCEDFPRDDENFDWETKSGRFAYLRIQAEHEPLKRDGDRFLRDHDHANPL